MEFLSYSMKWLELTLRWGHVLFAILFLGISIIYFQDYRWYNVDIIYTYLVGIIITGSFFSTIYFQVYHKQDVGDLSIS